MSQCTSCMVAFHRHRYYEPRETDSPAHRIATAMRIAIASDHAAVELKSALVQWLREQDHEITDLGPEGAASVDYPDYGYKLANSIAPGSADRTSGVEGTRVTVRVDVGCRRFIKKKQ